MDLEEIFDRDQDLSKVSLESHLYSYAVSLTTEKPKGRPKIVFISSVFTKIAVDFVNHRKL